MKIPSTSKLIKKHNNYIARFKKDKNFEKAHKKALKTLKHERLVHLIVTIAITVFCLAFFALYLFFALFLLLVTFIILACLTLAYFIYYFKLENTVIKWEEIDYDKSKK